MTTQTASPGLRVERHESTLDRVSVAFATSAVVTILFNAALTIVKDASQPLHDFMAKLTGHHWITHGIVVLAVFVILGWVLARSDAVWRLSDTRLVEWLVASTVLGGGAIAIWFLLV
jgi:hypothetical protein